MIKKSISNVLNLIIIILEIIGLVICFSSMGFGCFIYYTQLSNLFLLIASTIYLFRYRFKSRVVDILKFGATLSVLLTFLVVLFVLGIITDLGYHWLFLEGSNLYCHLICPLLGAITFLFFDDVKLKGLKDIIGALVFTIIYSIVLLVLNFMRVVEGPYPFLLVYKNPVYESVLWIILIEGGAFLLGYVLEKAKKSI